MLKPDSTPYLRSANINEFLPPVSRWTRLGGMVLIGSMGLVVILASLLKYNVTVKAAANVRPTGEVRIVQATMAGSIGLK